MTQTALAADAREPVSRTVLSQGVEIHYLDWGNAGAPLLLFLHGNSDHARSWDWTARRFADRFHVVAMDLRGHGDSGWSTDGGYLTPYHILDLEEVIDSLGEDQVTLVGHSFGGNISWQYAALYPERVKKLVVVDGLGPAPNALAAWEATGPVARLKDWAAKRRNPDKLKQRRFDTVEEMAGRMLKANPHLTPEQAHHLALHGSRRHADGLSWKFDPRVAMFTPHDFAVDGSHFWRKIACPTLLYYGTESWTTNPEEDGRAGHFSDQRTIVYEGAGHWVHHDRFEDFVTTLAQFV